MAQLNHCFLQYLEENNFEKTLKRFRRDCAIEGDYSSPNVTLSEFATFLGKHLGHDNSSTNDDKNGSDDEHGAGIKRKRQNDERSVVNTTPMPEWTGGVTSRVFLGNLAFKITEAKLHSFFADCGDITAIDWVTDKNTGQFYGTAFATFATPESAEKALSKNGKKCLERPIKINLATARGNNNNNSEGGHRKMGPMPKYDEKPDNCRSLFLGNLSFDVKEDHVRDFFLTCGTIDEVRLLQRPGGQFKGCAFVDFADESSLRDAVKLHTKPLLGRPVKIDWA